MIVLLREISDWVLGIGLFINACLFIPQIIKLYQTKDAAGTSLITFGGFCGIQMVAILNGYCHHDWAMVIGYALSLLTCGSVMVLAIRYRVRPKK